MKDRRRKEDRQETLHDHLVDLQFRFTEGAGKARGRNDRKMITYFFIIKEPFILLVLFQISFTESLSGKFAVLPSLLAFQYVMDRLGIIFRQTATVCSGIGYQFMALIQGLGKAQGVFG